MTGSSRKIDSYISGLARAVSSRLSSSLGGIAAMSIYDVSFDVTNESIEATYYTTEDAGCIIYGIVHE